MSHLLGAVNVVLRAARIGVRVEAASAVSVEGKARAAVTQGIQRDCDPVNTAVMNRILFNPIVSRAYRDRTTWVQDYTTLRFTDAASAVSHESNAVVVLFNWGL